MSDESSASLSVEEVSIARLHAAYLAGAGTARSIAQAYVDRITRPTIAADPI